MKKNILIVPGFVCDTYCSIEKLTVHLVNSLAADFNFIWLVPDIKYKDVRLKNRFNQIKLAHPKYMDAIIENKQKYIIGNISKFNLFYNFIFLRHIIIDHGIDAVYVQFGYERFWVAFIAKLLSKKVIWHEHWLSLRTKFIWFKRCFYAMFVDVFLAVSNHIAESLRDVGRPIVVVSNGKELSLFEKMKPSEKSEKMKKMGFDGNEIIILLVAAFRVMKRHDLAIDIIDHVRHNSTINIVFVFVGDGEMKGEVEKKVLQRGLSEFVKFTGHVDDVESYYSIADMAMLSSLYGEGLPYCLIEAMNYKLPIVAFNMEWAQELIDDDNNGFLIERENVVEFAKNIIKIADDNGLRERLGNGAYDFFVKYLSIDVWTENMKSAIDSLFV